MIDLGTPTSPSRRGFIARSAAALVSGDLLNGTNAIGAPTRGNESPTLQVQKLAWAGIRLQLGDANLFVDPLINPAVWGTALKDTIVPIESTPGDRFVLVTHGHPDHFDPLAVLKALGAAGTLVCDPDVAPLASAEGFNVRVASLYEPILLGEFTAAAVPAMDGY